MSDCATTPSITDDQPIGTSHGLLGFNSLIPQKSPDIQVGILKRIDCAIQNIEKKGECDEKFIGLYLKLKGLKRHVEGCENLPSPKVSLLIAVCKYVRKISTRDVEPSSSSKTMKVPVLKKETNLLIKDNVGAENGESESPKGAADSKPKKEGKAWGFGKVTNIVTDTMNINKVMNTMKPKKSKGEEENKTIVPKQKKKLVKVTSSEDGKGIARQRFQQISTMIDLLTSRKPIHEYSIRVLTEFDSIIAELHAEELGISFLFWFLCFMIPPLFFILLVLNLVPQKSDLQNLLQPAVEYQWRPILNFLRMVLFPIVALSVQFASNKVWNDQDEASYSAATIFLFLLAAPRIIAFKNHYSELFGEIFSFKVAMVLFVFVRLAVEFCTSVIFLSGALLFFSDVSCKEIASVAVKMYEK